MIYDKPLTTDEALVLRLAIETKGLRDFLDVEKLIAAGYDKTPRAASLWINRLTRNGYLESHFATSLKFWVVTRKGLDAYAFEKKRGEV